MRRALLIVLDSVGVGHAPDARAYGDEGANTLGHILRELPDLPLPTLRRLGLDLILAGASGTDVRQQWQEQPIACGIGWMREQSAGKDTTTGHWELVGRITREPFATFESFPPDLVAEIETRAGVRFIGNVAASGTDILDRLGDEHVRSGRPILYTSADSVLQIAAHEQHFGEARLQEVCRTARQVIDERGLRIGRVISRPFRGTSGVWQRTANRHDYSLRPPHNLLNLLTKNGVQVTAIGKISDIFSGSGISRSHPTVDNAEGCAHISRLWAAATPGLMFANLVDFDARHGHRRDVAGYGRCLVEFDRWLGAFVPNIDFSRDLVILTADHGNDPAWHGTDHTREQVPVWCLGALAGQWIGPRETFADVAATLADWFRVEPTGAIAPEARSWLT